MGYRRFRAWMLALAGVALVLSAAVVGAGQMFPMADFSDAAGGVAPGRRQPTKIVPASLTIDDFADSHRKSLQRPLVDPPPKEEVIVPVKPVAPPPKIDAILLGTAVESDVTHSLAWIRKAAGATAIKIRVGDVLSQLPGSPTVTSIQKGHVVLQVREHKFDVKMPKKDSL